MNERMNKQSTVMTAATASSCWRSVKAVRTTESGKRKAQVAQSEIKKMYAQQKGENAAVAQGTKEY